VTPFATSVPKGSQWYLIHKSERRAERSFQLFRDWIRAAVDADASRQPKMNKPAKLGAAKHGRRTGSGDA
jgi:hypothetical protein